MDYEVGKHLELEKRGEPGELVGCTKELWRKCDRSGEAVKAVIGMAMRMCCWKIEK